MDRGKRLSAALTMRRCWTLMPLPPLPGQPRRPRSRTWPRRRGRWKDPTVVAGCRRRRLRRGHVQRRYASCRTAERRATKGGRRRCDGCGEERHLRGAAAAEVRRAPSKVNPRRPTRCRWRSHCCCCWAHRRRPSVAAAAILLLLLQLRQQPRHNNSSSSRRCCCSQRLRACCPPRQQPPPLATVKWRGRASPKGAVGLGSQPRPWRQQWGNGRGSSAYFRRLRRHGHGEGGALGSQLKAER